MEKDKDIESQNHKNKTLRTQVASLQRELVQMRQRLAQKWTRLKERQQQGAKMTPLDPEKEPEVVCLNCGTTYRGYYCPKCGQKSNTGKLSISHAFSNMVGILLNTESGFVHTCLELLYRPGYMIRDYVKGRRAGYIRPIQLLFVLTTIYLVLHYLFTHTIVLLTDPGSLLDEIVNQESKTIEDKRIALLGVVGDFLKNQAYSALTLSVLMLLPGWVCFRKSNASVKVSLTEMFYILVFISCLKLLFSILLMPYDLLMHDSFSSFNILFVLMMWSFHQYFQIKWSKAFWRTCLSFVLLLLLIIAFCILIPVALELAGYNVLERLKELD